MKSFRLIHNLENLTQQITTNTITTNFKLTFKQRNNPNQNLEFFPILRAASRSISAYFHNMRMSVLTQELDTLPFYAILAQVVGHGLKLSSAVSGVSNQTSRVLKVYYGIAAAAALTSTGECSMCARDAFSRGRFGAQWKAVLLHERGLGVGSPCVAAC